ncbi:DsbA family protein [Sphingomonas bacterium]|uniref:DsbA family protein n=1 Tax=Sphingomonas bacterium TaxID=1895847 RepID=UPI0015772832|nr:thioredoxin domain-containing protein [Sphingomonas bacterium]
MRYLLALLLLPLLLAAATARDWTQTTSRLPNGGYLLGNPAARVKLVEYGSYTCPHCAAFAAESGPVLHDRWVKDGSVSLELRNLIRDAADLAAAVVARCTGPKYYATSYLIFARQDVWLNRAINFQQTNAARINMYPPLARLRAIADGSGLSDVARAQGVSDDRLDACFADQAAVDRIVAMTAGAQDVTGTPTFFLDGKRVDGFTWDKVEPLLRARGLK